MAKYMMLLKKTGVGKIMMILKLFQYLNITLGNIVTKLLKYSILAVVVLVAIGFITGITPMDTIRYMTKLIMKQEGLKMQTATWKEFDFTNIKGEEEASIFGGLSKARALMNYRINTFYPFDGEVGFVGGSDYKKQRELHHHRENKQSNNYDMYFPSKHETAYLFITNDEQTFTKNTLGHGFVSEIIKYNENYYVIIEDYLWNAKTLVSRDKGKTWREYFNKSIEAFFSKNNFIFSEPTGIQTVQRVSRFKYFYTKDGGKTSIPLSEKMLSYAKNMHPKFQHNFRLVFNVYEGRLLFLDGKDLVSVDIDTGKETRTVLKFPEGYKLASYISRKYGENLLEQHKTRDINLNALQINKENGKPYILLQKNDTNDTIPAQISIWYPFENTHIIFDKKISKIVPLRVSGNYVGGVVKKNSILIHVWSLDNGKTWEYEFLSDYYLLVGPKVMYNKIWMTAIVRGERPDGKEGYPKFKGSYLIMGTLESKKEKPEILPENFSLQNPRK